jgi:hypothetical protein
LLRCTTYVSFDAALHIAIERKHFELASHLLLYGPPLDVRDDAGNTVADLINKLPADDPAVVQLKGNVSSHTALHVQLVLLWEWG